MIRLLAPGTQVTLRRDTVQPNRDRFNRLLRYVARIYVELTRGAPLLVQRPPLPARSSHIASRMSMLWEVAIQTNPSIEIFCTIYSSTPT